MSKALSSLPIGAKVKDPNVRYFGQPIIWKVGTHTKLGSGKTGLIAEKILCLKCFDAKEPSNSNSDRKNYGNNKWSVSNIRQWLNSDAVAGSWYTKQHTADQSPDSSTYTSNNPYTSEAGFLSNFSSDFKAALQSVTHTVALNTVTDGGGSEQVTDKIFFLSNTMVGLATENNINEGEKWELFADNESRKAYPTAEAVSHSDYTSSSFAVGQAWYYWLCTPNSGDSYYARHVSTDGSLYYNVAYGGNGGVRPACSLSSSDIKVTDAADSDGVYTILWNQAPEINTEESLGDKNGAFSIHFTVTDAEGDATTASAVLTGSGMTDVTLLANSAVTLGQEKTVNISYSQLTSLTIGQTYTVRITATDSAGNSSVKNVTFKRIASTVIISGADANLGTKWKPWELRYSVSDTDSATTLTVTEEVDDMVTRTFTATNGEETAFNIADWWDEAMAEEDHTLTIRATNGNASSVRVYTFTKLSDKLEFSTKPIRTDMAAHSVLIMVQTEATGYAELKVEAANDAADGNPTWEDATYAVQTGKPHIFANEPAGGYGVSVRVTVTKGDDCERVYCTAVGFSFK